MQDFLKLASPKTHLQKRILCFGRFLFLGRSELETLKVLARHVQGPVLKTDPAKLKLAANALQMQTPFVLFFELKRSAPTDRQPTTRTGLCIFPHPPLVQLLPFGFVIVHPLLVLSAGQRSVSKISAQNALFVLAEAVNLFFY